MLKCGGEGVLERKRARDDPPSPFDIFFALLAWAAESSQSRLPALVPSSYSPSVLDFDQFVLSKAPKPQNKEIVPKHNIFYTSGNHYTYFCYLPSPKRNQSLVLYSTLSPYSLKQTF